MNVSNDFIRLQQRRYNLFKAQNPETGRFDVVFEVEGKLLYAHKNMLTLDSETFHAMLSDRVAKKDQSIKIKDYSYDDFYQLLIYQYTGKCQLTDSNVFALFDMAKFYGLHLFKNYCYNYLSTMEITTANVFQLMGKKFSYIQQARANDFIAKNSSSIINSDEFLETSKDLAKRIITDHKYNFEPEDVFKAVYKWCEKQAADAPNLIYNDAIKAEISDFLSHIFFRGMDSKFLNEFVVPRGFIFSSFNELSKILSDCGRFFEGKIKITNQNGQTLHGNVIPDKTILRNIESLKEKYCYDTTPDCIFYCWWKTEFKCPSTPSPLTKRESVQWYLSYFSDGNIGVEHYSLPFDNHYLLAELTPGTTGFDGANCCIIEIE